MTPKPKISLIVISRDEEEHIGQCLRSAWFCDELILVDSFSTDRTVEIAKSCGAKVIVEDWKGYAAQKNSAIDKAGGEWVLSLDADEEADEDLVAHIGQLILGWQRNTRKDKDPVFQITVVASTIGGFWIRRKNEFLGRWIKHGGFWPDPKLRLFRRGAGKFEDRAVHEDLQINGKTGLIRIGALLHHSYPTLSDYIDHMNRYSSLGAEMVVAKGQRGFSVFNIVIRPAATFLYNYAFRLGFLDGREGLLLHLYHAVYVSWKYAKAWELARKKV